MVSFVDLRMYRLEPFENQALRFLFGSLWFVKNVKFRQELRLTTLTGYSSSLAESLFSNAGEHTVPHLHEHKNMNNVPLPL